MPFIVKSELAITPPVRFMVKLLINGVVRNNELGKVNAVVPPKVREDSEFTSIKPDVFTRPPFIDKVVVPTFKFPLVNVRTSLTLMSENIVTPVLLFIINFSKLIIAPP
jgi:hypothetical protein